MLRIYIASPYSHPDAEVVARRVERVAAVTARINESAAGIHAYSPIVHGHHLPHAAEIARNDGFWKPLNEDEIRRSDELWVLTLDGWEKSVGVSREINYALERGMTVRHVRPDCGDVAGAIFGALEAVGKESAV